METTETGCSNHTILPTSPPLIIFGNVTATISMNLLHNLNFVQDLLSEYYLQFRRV